MQISPLGESTLSVFDDLPSVSTAWSTSTLLQLAQLHSPVCGSRSPGRCAEHLQPPSVCGSSFGCSNALAVVNSTTKNAGFVCVLKGRFS